MTRGAFTMVKRAKLMLDAVDPATLQTARKYGRLIARLKLTDASRNPLCAANPAAPHRVDGHRRRLSGRHNGQLAHCPPAATPLPAAGW